MENYHGVVMLGTYIHLSVNQKWSGEDNKPDPPGNKYNYLWMQGFSAQVCWLYA